MGKLSTLVVDLQLQSAQLKDELKKVNDKLDDFSKRALKTGDVLKGVFGAQVLKDGFDALTGFMRSSFEGMLEDERAANTLGAALRNMGYDAAAVVPALQAQAEALERTTLVDASETMALQRLMIQYGAAPNVVGSATEAILDYAAATGQDASTATRTLLNAVSVGKDEVAKLGIAYESTGNLTTDLVSATAALEEKFGGTAKAATEGLAGSMGVLAQRTEDLGKWLTQSLTQSLLEATGGANGLKTSLTVIETLMKLLASAGALIVATFSNIGTAIAAALSAMVNLVSVALKLGEAMRSMPGSANQMAALDEAKKAFGEYIEGVQAGGEAIVANTERTFKRLSTIWTAAAEPVASALPGQSAEAAEVERQRREEADRKAREEADKKAKAWIAKTEKERHDVLKGAVAAWADSFKMARRIQNEAFERAEKAAAVSKQLADDAAMLREKMRDATQAAADALEQRRQEFVQSQSQKLMGGTVSGLVQAGQEGFAAGGPWGALAAVGVELVTRSKQFQRIMEFVETLIQNLADAFGGLLTPLLPLIIVIEEMLAPVFAGLQVAFAWFFQGISFLVLKIMQFARWVIQLWNGVQVMLGQRQNVFDTSGLTNAINRLSSATYETALNTQALGDAARDATEEILNAPQGFKALALARWGAVNPESAPPWAGGAGGGTGGGGGGAGGGGRPEDREHGAGSGGGFTPGGTGTGGSSGPVVTVAVGVDVRRYVQVEMRTDQYGTGNTSEVVETVPEGEEF